MTQQKLQTNELVLYEGMLQTQTKALSEIITKIEFQSSQTSFPLKAGQISTRRNGQDAAILGFTMVMAVPSAQTF